MQNGQDSNSPPENAADTLQSIREAARLTLARLNLMTGRTLREALLEMSTTIAPVLRVNRISVWFFLEDRQAIRCDYLHQPPQREVFGGTIFYARDFPGYFEALQRRRVVSVTDVASDPLMLEFREAYFQPLGITAMLDAPIYQAGEILGIVCNEQVGPRPSWTELDHGFAALVADTIARLYEESTLLQAERRIGAFQAQAVELQRIAVLGRLAAGMAHDFKNVLTAIFGYANLIASAAADNEEVLSLVEGLQAAARQGTQMTSDLLMLGQNRQGKPCLLDLAKAIEQCSPLLRMALGKQSTLQLTLSPSVSRVFLDASQLERALLNLALNAKDAMPLGGKLEIRLDEVSKTKESSTASTYVLLEVRDTGVGMDAPTQERLFEPFFTTKGNKGTGLGLTIVRQLVTLAGGFIEVQSEPGRGTSIRIYLPGIPSTGG